MSQQQAVEFALRGTIAGKPISARHGVPFTRFAEFNADVLKYVQGGDARSALHDVQVQIEEGSYLLRVLLPAGILTSLITDTAKVAESGNLAEIHPKRAEVIEHWLSRAKMETALAYVVSSPTQIFPAVTITEKSSFRRDEETQWVNVERYLIGTITDWGGAQAVNVHLRPRNSTGEIIIAASEGQIRDQKDNLVYHKALVHVRAKQNARTGDLKDYKLIELRAYGPNVEDRRLQELFAKGSEAWAGVTEAGTWVESLRGGAHV